MKKKFEIMDDVIVPEPNKGDAWMHSFIGIIIDILDDGKRAIVEDQDSDCWEVEIDRLSKPDEE